MRPLHLQPSPPFSCLTFPRNDRGPPPSRLVLPSERERRRSPFRDHLLFSQYLARRPFFDRPSLPHQRFSPPVSLFLQSFPSREVARFPPSDPLFQMATITFPAPPPFSHPPGFPVAAREGHLSSPRPAEEPSEMARSRFPTSPAPCAKRFAERAGLLTVSLPRLGRAPLRAGVSLYF